MQARPHQIYAEARAIVQTSVLEQEHNIDSRLQDCDDTAIMQSVIHQQPRQPASTGYCIFTDAAWTAQPGQHNAPAGLGIVIVAQNDQHFKELHISAKSQEASTPLQAEAFALHLAVKVAEVLNIQEPKFYTDNSTLVQATKAESIFDAGTPWIIRPTIANIRASQVFRSQNIEHISRCYNIKAHHQARLASRIQAGCTSLYRCLSTADTQCPCLQITRFSG